MIHFEQLFLAVLGFNFLNLLAMLLFVCSLMRSMYVQVMDDRPLLRFLQPLTLPHALILRTDLGDSDLSPKT